MNTMEEVKKTGMLGKQTEAGWKKRYVKLTDTKLLYFKSEVC